MKTALIYFLKISAGLLLGVLLLAVMLLAWPGLVVNTTVFSWAASLAGRAGYRVHWEAAEISAESLAPWHQRYRFAFRGLCLDAARGRWATTHACFETFEVMAEILWDGRRWSVPVLGPVTVLGRDVFLPVPPSEEAEKKKEGLKIRLPELVLPRPLRETVFQPVVIELPRVQVAAGNKLYLGSVLAAAEPDAWGRLPSVSAQANLFEGIESTFLGAGVLVSSASRFLENDAVFDLAANARRGGDSGAEAEVELFQPRPGILSYRIDAAASVREARYTVTTSGELGDKALAGRIRASGKGFVDRIQVISVPDCPYRFRETEAKSGRGRFDFDCPVHVDLTPLRLPSGTFTRLVTVPYHWDLTLKVDLETDLLPTPASRVDGRLDLGLVPHSQELFTAKGGVAARFSGVPAEYPDGWTIEANSDFSFLSRHFQKIVHALDRTAFAVPAPLNALDGTLEFQLKGISNVTGNTGRVPVTFKTRLSSSEQDFNTDGEGELTYRLEKKGAKTADLTLELLLSKVRIALPRFGFSSLPNLFLDSRIQPQEKRKKAGPGLALGTHIKIKTGDEPARLTSHLVEESIPLLFDLDVMDGKMGGTITVGGTTFTLFRKRARLEELKILLRDPMETSEVDGHLRATWGEYRIDVFLVGTVGKPHVVFESVPPLRQDQMVAALLYGQPFEDLDENQSSSVANTSAAMAQKSVALGSLFLLASSPIESVNYNPDTGAFTARVRLAEGTLLRVTTQERKQEFGVRKNLSGNWVVNTYVENDSEERKQTGVVLFEWIKRY